MWHTRPYCFWQRNTIRRIFAWARFHFIKHLVGCDLKIQSLLIFLSRLRHYDIERWVSYIIWKLTSCHLNYVVCMLQVTTFRVFLSSSLLGFMFSTPCWLSKYSIFLMDKQLESCHTKSLQNKPIMFSDTSNCFQRDIGGFKHMLFS